MENIDSFLRLQEALQSNERLLVTRFSCGMEMIVCEYYLLQRLEISPPLKIKFTTETGIHCTTKASLDRYAQSYIEACLRSDFVCYWDKINDVRTPSMYAMVRSKKSMLSAFVLEPYYFMSDSRYALNEILRGKRILVVSSFTDSMRSQVDTGNVYKIFPKRIFEDNQFIFVRPPVTLAQNHGGVDWQHHVERFKRDVDFLDFDLALVGCGGYGNILSQHLYDRFKKTVLYIGGPIQLLFGIKGDRWRSSSSYVSRHFNEHWIDPLESDIPNNHKMVENGCYW